MITTNLTEFRRNIKKYLDDVIDNFETLIINRGKDKGVVIMSLKEYNSWEATLHEMSSVANIKALDKAIQQLKEGKTVEKDLLE